MGSSTCKVGVYIISKAVFAAFLLINNKVNISEVAYKVGFSSHSYFSNSFHDYFGLTPKEFVAKYSDCKDEDTLKRIFE